MGGSANLADLSKNPTPTAFTGSPRDGAAATHTGSRSREHRESGLTPCPLSTVPAFLRERLVG